MAKILLSTLMDALGGPVPVDAVLTFTATRSRASGAVVVANGTVTVRIVAGVPTEDVDLVPSGVDWAYKATLSVSSIGRRIDRTVAVPDVPSVEWADLVDVDPATLLPAESAVPAWTAAVGQVAAALADTETARDGAVTAQGLSEAARDLALAGQFAGADLGTSDLNTITTPGVYRQGTTANATLVLNYPVASVQGVLEVFHSTATSSIFQRYMQTTGTASSKGHWQRRYTSSAWSAWGFVATQRVDQTAGRAIYTWDYANNREQMIYGDTGWLDISTLLLNGWGGMVRMRRTGADVQLAAQNVTLGSGTTALTIPIGFRAQGGFPVFGRAATGNTPIAGSLNTGTLAFPTNVAFHGFSFQTAFSTGDTWPSSLPGTAEGSIPA